MTGRLDELARLPIAISRLCRRPARIPVQTVVRLLDRLQHALHALLLGCIAALSSLDACQKLAVDVADLRLAQLLGVSACRSALLADEQFG